MEPRLINRLEWKNLPLDTETKCVKVMQGAAANWPKLALCLGLNPSEVETIRQNYSTDDTRVITVFGQWLSNANNLPNSKRYPKKWSGLIKLLKDSDLGQLAEDVKKALSASYSDVKDNLE